MEEVLMMLELMLLNDISARTLKATVHTIALAFTTLNCNGSLSKVWKGDPSDPANYRPISLLQVLSKLLEVLSKLLDVLSKLLEVLSNLLEVLSKLLEVLSKLLEVLQVLSKLLEVLQVLSKLLEVT